MIVILICIAAFSFISLLQACTVYRQNSSTAQTVVIVNKPLTLSDALMESKTRYEAGDRQANSSISSGQLDIGAPFYMRPNGTHAVRWFPYWSYQVSGEDLIANDWQRVKDEQLRPLT